LLFIRFLLLARCFLIIKLLDCDFPPEAPARPYDQNQQFLLPPSLNEWVKKSHPARIFSNVVDQIDISGDSSSRGTIEWHIVKPPPA
jgi:hypothetical protein